MPTQNTDKLTKADGSQPVLHQHGHEIQQYGSLRGLPDTQSVSRRQRPQS